MPRSKKPIAEIDLDLLVAGEPTAAGHVFSEVILLKIAEAMGVKPVTIEELSPVERKAKGKPICYSWPEHAMAVSTAAAVEAGVLKVKFAVSNNKYGKLLMTTAESAGGFDKMVFMPVGIGDIDTDGNISDGYSIQYVTFKPTVPNG